MSIRTRTSGITFEVAPPPTAVTPLDALIAGLAADGLTAKLDRLWVFAQATEALALVDIIVGATATTINSPTFTANRGYAGDGATSYIDSNYNPSTNGVSFLLNSASLHVWNNTSRASNVSYIMGCHDGSQSAYMSLFDSNLLFSSMNNAGGSRWDNTLSDGFFTSTRVNSGSASTDQQAYRNGAALTFSVGNASTVVPSLNIFICAGNFSGAPGNYTTDQVAAAAMGGAFSATDATNFYNRLRTYMTAVGVP